MIADDREADNIENIETKLPTTLYIPKSSTPNAFKTILDVYKLIKIVKSIRKYNSNVFFAILLLCIYLWLFNGVKLAVINQSSKKNWKTLLLLILLHRFN